MIVMTNDKLFQPVYDRCQVFFPEHEMHIQRSQSVMYTWSRKCLNNVILLYLNVVLRNTLLKTYSHSQIPSPLTHCYIVVEVGDNLFYLLDKYGYSILSHRTASEGIPRRHLMRA